MSPRAVQISWFVGVVIWAATCAVVWFVGTRDDYARLYAARACYDTSLQSQDAGLQCANLKQSDILVYRAEIDRKARISRVTAGLGAGTAIALWFILGRPGFRSYR
jgi:hypothetical protein